MVSLSATRINNCCSEETLKKIEIDISVDFIHHKK